jgi:hypothetical protein
MRGSMTRIRAEGSVLVSGTFFFLKRGHDGERHLCCTKNGEDHVFFTGTERSCNQWLDHLFHNHGVADFTKQETT